MEREPVSRESGPKEALERIRRIYKLQCKALDVIPLPTRGIPHLVKLDLIDGTEVQVASVDQYCSLSSDNPYQSSCVPAHVTLAHHTNWPNGQTEATGYRIFDLEPLIVELRTDQGVKGLIDPLETPERWQEFIGLIDQAESAII